MQPYSQVGRDRERERERERKREAHTLQPYTQHIQNHDTKTKKNTTTTKSIKTNKEQFKKQLETTKDVTNININ